MNDLLVCLQKWECLVLILWLIDNVFFTFFSAAFSLRTYHSCHICELFLVTMLQFWLAPRWNLGAKLYERFKLLVEVFPYLERSPRGLGRRKWWKGKEGKSRLFLLWMGYCNISVVSLKEMGYYTWICCSLIVLLCLVGKNDSYTYVE